MKILYTCITGNYDSLIPIKKQAGWRYICFTDNPKLRSGVWEIVLIKSEPKIFRKVKLVPHQFLPQHEVSIWTDGNIELLWNLDFLIAGNEFCTMRHPDRNNIYDEAQACIRLKKDDEKIIREQMAAYLADGYKGKGLIGSGVIIRKNTAENKAFGLAWWNEVQLWSVRDQLSFNYVADKLKLKYNTIGFLERCKYYQHTK
jgi:hypothetical protein